MKCRRCREPAVIDIRRHNAAFCSACFLHHCREQVRRAIHDFDMFGPEDRVLIAVSGGKDSLAAWDLLLELGYQVDGLYIGLGIGEYSDHSHEFARAFAEERGLLLHEVDLAAEYDFDVNLVLRKEEIPDCRLGSGTAVPPMLGWTTWLKSGPSARDASDLILDSMF